MFKLIIPIFLIVLSGGLFFSYIDPTYTKMGDLKKEQSEYDNALTKSKELRELRSQLLSKYNTFSVEEIERLEKLLPDNIDNVRLIMEIDHIAVKNGGMIRSVEVNSSASDKDKNGNLGPNLDGYESIRLSFVIESSYDDFINFIDDLGNSLRIVDITNYSLKASRAEDTYKHSIDLKTYWLK